MNGLKTKSGLALLLAAALTLGGCFKISNGLPPDAPAYVKVYPGATGVMSIDAGIMKSVTFQAPDTPATVMLFYRSQAAAAQMPESQSPNQTNAPAGQESAVFGDPKDNGAFMVVAARPQPQGQGSTVSLMYKPAPKAGA
jgi:hypothetical protein